MPKKKTNTYWEPDVMDNHVVHYNSLTDAVEKNEYFEKHLYHPLNKLCECITRRWKFGYIPFSLEDMQTDLLGFLVSKLHLYKPEKGHSFGWLTVVAKNYLMTINNAHYKHGITHYSIHQDHRDKDEQVERMLEQAFKFEQKELPEYCDPHFLNLLKDFWFKFQINTDSPAFFKKDFNSIILEMLRIMGSPADYTINRGIKDFHNLIRMNPDVSCIDNRHQYSQCRTTKTTHIIKKCKKVCRLAYSHYLKHGNLDALKLTRTSAFNLTDSVRHARWRNKKRLLEAA